jgi:hypothetical protein
MVPPTETVTHLVRSHLRAPLLARILGVVTRSHRLTHVSANAARVNSKQRTGSAWCHCPILLTRHRRLARKRSTGPKPRGLPSTTSGRLPRQMERTSRFASWSSGRLTL